MSETRWRCYSCGRLNVGLQFCPTCRMPSPLTPDQRLVRCAPAPPTDVVERYPDHDTFESFGLSARAIGLVSRLCDTQSRATYECCTNEDRMSSQEAITALSNADGDLLTYIAELEATVRAAAEPVR